MLYDISQQNSEKLNALKFKKSAEFLKKLNALRYQSAAFEKKLNALKFKKLKNF